MYLNQGTLPYRVASGLVIIVPVLLEIGLVCLDHDHGYVLVLFSKDMMLVHNQFALAFLLRVCDGLPDYWILSSG